MLHCLLSALNLSARERRCLLSQHSHAQEHHTAMQDVPQIPPAETIDLASMTVEESYDGPHLQGQPPHHQDLASPPPPRSHTIMDLLHACAYIPQKGCKTDVHVVLT